MGIRQVGRVRFSGFHAEVIGALEPFLYSFLEIYERLSHSQSLLPPALGFIFDQDGRPEQKQKELIHKSQGKLTFLPRQLYENYLLNANAIAEVINRFDNRESPLTTSDVQAWIDQHKGEQKYYWSQPPGSEMWQIHIHGAKFLDALFCDLTETRVNYKAGKVRYSAALTEYLIEHAPDDLRELANLLQSKLDAKAKSLSS